MKRTATSFCVAAAFGCIASLGAQTPATSTTTTTGDKARDVTITGCLSKGADGNFMLNNASVDNPMGNRSSSTTGTATTTGGTTATGTTPVTPQAGAMKNAASSWVLAGGSDLDKHVGHKIQVTGRSNWDSAMDHSRMPDPTTSAPGTTTGTTGTTSTAAAEARKDTRSDAPKLDVQSVKMIAPSCS